MSIKISAFLLFQFTFSWIAMGQICEGNFGENIFTEGDFGSGVANIPLVNPQIAPGYTYTTSPPPNDGFYTITNDISAWGYAFTWIELPSDNSPDPQGYMMVVNASFEPGLFYVQEVDDLCDNTLYQFSVDVFNLKNPGANGIRPNLSFLIDGEDVYDTGDVPENNQWNTYSFTFTTNPGQTSITLSLQNNAPGGTGNDLALDNITFRPCGPEALILPTEIANICEDGSPIDLEATIVGDQYDDPAVQWQQSFDDGASWNDIPGANALTYTHNNLAAGFYYYRYLLANGAANLVNAKCRVVSNVKIVRVVPKFYTVQDTICEGIIYEFGDEAILLAGTYVDSLLTVIGCDSIVTLELAVVPDEGISPVLEVVDPSCSNEVNGSIQINELLNGTPPYSVTLNGTPVMGMGLVANLAEGDYELEVVDYFGCQLDTLIQLQAPLIFLVDLGPDQVVELGESLQLSPTATLAVANYEWEPAGLIDCTNNCESIEWIPFTSTSLSLTVTSEEGCLATDSIQVEVNAIRKVYIPNAFSPNLDGVNDAFTIYGDIPNVQQIDQLVIVDRWGGVVFQQQDFLPNDASQGWRGTARGKPVPEGVYVYSAEIRFLDGAVVRYEGDITLIR